MGISYLFDFDGTLVDSMPTYVSAMLRILDETKAPYDKRFVKTHTDFYIYDFQELLDLDLTQKA